jgi:DNA-binding transcriptional LysR family regulator
MDIHRLEVFCKLVELQSFTKAADAACLTQPTVSEHIRALEEMLGEKLVDRLGREVLPTPAGKILYGYAQSIIKLRNEAVQAIEQYKGNLSGHLFIGAGTIPGTYILPEYIGHFKTKFPSIRITLGIASSGEIVQKLLDGLFELALIGARWDERRITLEEIFSDELVLTVYPEHPWARRKSIKIDELDGEPFILREKGSGTRRVINKALETHGFDPGKLLEVAEMGNTESVRQGIKAKIGVSILSSKAVAEDLSRGTLVGVDMDGIHLSRPFYLAQRRNRKVSPLCTAFLDYLRSEAARRTNP